MGKHWWIEIPYFDGNRSCLLLYYYKGMEGNMSNNQKKVAIPKVIDESFVII
jgi:hypothetical protein